MAEKIDLNALRSSVPEQEETRDQKIERLNREIAELEQKIHCPSRYDSFMALPVEEKEAEVVAANKTVPVSEQFANVDAYAESIQPVKGAPNIDKMRLEMKKAQLEGLKGS